MNPITRKEMFLAKAMGADVETPTPITRMEVLLSSLSGGGGLTELPEGYPYKTGMTIEWDGNTEGFEVIPMEETTSLVKVSDIELTKEQLNGAKIKFHSNAGVIEYNATAIQEMDGIIMIMHDSMPHVVYAKNSSQFPDGLYFLMVDYRGTHQWVSSLSFGTIHTIAPEFLPSEEWTFTLEDGTTVTKKVVVAE